VAKPELGTKRQCRSCGNRFYDLTRDPIACPKCGAIFELVEVKGPAGGAAKDSSDEDAKLEKTAGPEIVSLEEVEAVGDDKALEVEDEAEAAEASPGDETFLEEEEEGEDDVSALIDGDIEDDEEA
jgi:uncharacterized protein (TIGR02300 family)